MTPWVSHLSPQRLEVPEWWVPRGGCSQCVAIYPTYPWGGLDANHAWTGDQVLQIPSVNILVFAQLQSCTASYLSTGLLWRSEFQCALVSTGVWSLLAALTSLWVSVKSAAYNYYQGQTKWILYSFTTYNIADLNTLRSGRVNLHLCLQQINSAAICSSTPYAQVIINMGLRIICSVIVQNLSLQAEITACIMWLK